MQLLLQDSEDPVSLPEEHLLWKERDSHSSLHGRGYRGRLLTPTRGDVTHDPVCQIRVSRSDVRTGVASASGLDRTFRFRISPRSFLYIWRQSR